LPAKSYILLLFDKRKEALIFLFNPFSGLSPLYPLFTSLELPLNKYPVPTTPDVQLEGC